MYFSLIIYETNLLHQKATVLVFLCSFWKIDILESMKAKVYLLK